MVAPGVWLPVVFSAAYLSGVWGALRRVQAFLRYRRMDNQVALMSTSELVEKKTSE